MRRIAALAVVLCVSASAFAALTPGQKMAVEALIKQFTAAEFDQRQKAVDRLVEMGPDVVPVVKDALARTLDAEVKLRCEMVLKALGALDAPATPKDKFGYGPSKITLDVKDMPLAEVVEKLAAQSGNKPIRVADALKEKTVTLSLKDADYWVAVQALCDPLNLLVMPVFRGMGNDDLVPPVLRGVGNDDAEAAWFELREADRDMKLVGFSGPVVVMPDSFNQTIVYRQARAKIPGMLRRSGGWLTFWYYYEDRIEPLASSIEVLKVLAPDGKTFPPMERPAFGTWGTVPPAGQRSWPWGSTTLTLPELPNDLRKFAEISGIVRLEFVSGEREVRIDDVLNAVGKETKFDDWTVKVTKAEKTNWGLLVQVEASFKGQLMPMPQWMSAGGYGWWVQEPEGGKKTRGFSYGGATVWGGGGVRGGPVRANPAPLKKGEFSITFQGNYQGGAYALVLLLPTVHETKEFPFTIKDVPLP